jgi:serine protease inhibitor
MNAIRTTLAAAALSLAACSSATGPDGAPTQLEQLPRTLTTAESEMLRASNDFAFGILRETVRTDAAPNVLLSPLSATLALSMAMNGATGATLDEMRSALAFGSTPLSGINAANESLTELLLGLDAGVDMRIANSIWAREGFPFEQSFFDTARRWYSAQIATLDFNATSAAPTINAWVDRSTRGRISEIVEAPIPGDAVMYLINAVYFKSSWRDQFKASDTRDAPFTLRDGSTRQVQMMSRGGPAHYHRAADGTEILEQLYSRGAFAMTIVLPPAGTDVDALAESLDAETWHAWMEALRERDFDIEMPKYRVEYKTLMNDALIALGMRTPFDERDADFSAMSPAGDGLFISRVQQKTYMDVNEEGTEAAAVTSVEVTVTSMPVRTRVVVDRPFIVAIRERFSGAILFIGRIGEPSI